MNKNFCKVPFSQLEISPSGECRVCCKMDPAIVITDNNNIPYKVQDTPLSDIWKSDWMKDLRKKFIAGEKLKECQVCWDDEAAGVASFRQISNQIFEVEVNTPKLTDLILKLSNKCNCACRICNSYLSSLWQLENGETINHDSKLTNWEDWKNILRNSRSLLLFGGEPLLNPEVITILEFLVEEDLAKDISLNINTNGTITNDKIFNILKQFKYVLVFFSIDDINGRYNYERWPAKFDNINKDLLDLHNKEYQIEMGFYTTISIFNVFHIDEILNKFKSFNKWFVTFNNILHNPDYLCIWNLPEEIKPEVIRYINSVNLDNINWKDNLKPNLIDFLNLYKSPYSKEEYIKLLNEKLGPVDMRRNQNWKKTFPKLYNLLIEG